ncbi:MAG: hypothetical protein ACLRFR_03520 [Clostridia bacterium]
MKKFDISEFIERYTIQHEEFCFVYKDMKIEFVCEKTCYPVVVQYSNGKVEQYEFSSPVEALSKMRFYGKDIHSIWNDIE